MSRGGGQGGALSPPLDFELSFICIGFSLINDVRARGLPPLQRVAPPGKFSGYTHGCDPPPPKNPKFKIPPSGLLDQTNIRLLLIFLLPSQLL